MALNNYCAKVLARELAGSDYDGMTADQAWEWLMLPTVNVANEDTHALLTPVFAAGCWGRSRRIIWPLKLKLRSLP